MAESQSILNEEEFKVKLNQKLEQIQKVRNEIKAFLNKNGIKYTEINSLIQISNCIQKHLLISDITRQVTVEFVCQNDQKEIEIKVRYGYDNLTDKKIYNLETEDQIIQLPMHTTITYLGNILLINI